MNLAPLTDEQIVKLFASAGLGAVTDIRKIPIGFSNDVYDVDNRFILKSSRTSDDDEIDLRKEICLSEVVKGVVPAPVIVRADESRALIDRVFIVYEKIPGDNLYTRWHEYSTDERRAIIKQICAYIRAIALLPYGEFVAKFNLTVPTDWEAFVVSRIRQDVARALAMNALTAELAVDIESFVQTHSDSLKQSSVALSYADPHFDNFIVRDAQIVGMLDFEGAQVCSVDWVLHLVQRMQNEPTKYASEAVENSIVPADYAHLMDWYKEFYPELFAFQDMEMRLKLYAIKHNLSDLVGWPHVESLRDNLRNIMNP